MDPDNYELVWKLLTKPAQLRDVVEAVNSAIGPELEQNELPAEFLQRQRTRRVEPFKSGGELRRSELFTKVGHRSFLIAVIASMPQVMPEDEHIPDLYSVLVMRLAVIPEIVLADVVDPEAAFLIKGNVAKAGIRCSDQHLPLTAAARLGDQPADELLTKPVPLSLGNDR